MIRQVVTAGGIYDSQVRIDGSRIDPRTFEYGAGETPEIILRMHPRAGEVSVAGRTYHMQAFAVTAYRPELVNGTCTERECGPYNCRDVQRACVRTQQVPYATTEDRPVDDFACTAGFTLAPRVGGTYILQFDYPGGGQCQMSCFEQVTDASGAATLSPCEQAVIPQTR